MRSLPLFVISGNNASRLPFAPARILFTVSGLGCSWSSSINPICGRVPDFADCSREKGRKNPRPYAMLCTDWIPDLRIRFESAGEASTMRTASRYMTIA